MEILELRDQLQDAQDAISEAHGNSAGLKEHNRRLEAQIACLEQQLADAMRCPGIPSHKRLPMLPLMHGHAVLCSHCQQSISTYLHKLCFFYVSSKQKRWFHNLLVSKSAVLQVRSIFSVVLDEQMLFFVPKLASACMVNLWEISETCLLTAAFGKIIIEENVSSAASLIIPDHIPMQDCGVPHLAWRCLIICSLSRPPIDPWCCRVSLLLQCWPQKFPLARSIFQP